MGVEIEFIPKDFQLIIIKGVDGEFFKNGEPINPEEVRETTVEYIQNILEKANSKYKGLDEKLSKAGIPLDYILNLLKCYSTIENCNVFDLNEFKQISCDLSASDNISSASINIIQRDDLMDIKIDELDNSEKRKGIGGSEFSTRFFIKETSDSTYEFYVLKEALGTDTINI